MRLVLYAPMEEQRKKCVGIFNCSHILSRQYQISGTMMRKFRKCQENQHNFQTDQWIARYERRSKVRLSETNYHFGAQTVRQQQIDNNSQIYNKIAVQTPD